MKRNKFCSKRAIAEIGKYYQRFDGDYEKVVVLSGNGPISKDGLSLLDDIEFFLSQPDFSKEIEAELFNTIQLYSLKFLRARRKRND